MISAVSPGARDVFQLKVIHSELSCTEQRRATLRVTSRCKNIENLVDFKMKTTLCRLTVCFVYAPHVKA